jgi:IS5 family transposase
MRLKTSRQLYLVPEFDSSVKVVREYVEKYRKLDELLKANPQVLDVAHEDFCKYLSESEDGRESRFTSEEILRALLVRCIEQDALRGAVVRIALSDFLRSFIGFGIYKEMMSHTFLDKASVALSPQTWEAMNAVLAAYGRDEELITGEKLRTDTSVVEANIHYPTDSSLLWDSFRVLARVLQRVQQERGDLGLTHRYHIKKVKKLAYFIARNAGKRSRSMQRKVKRAYRTLVDRVCWIVQVCHEVRMRLGASACLDAPELESYPPIVERIIDQTERRVFAGEIVPAEEKVYSLFEEHTELVIRGKAGKPVEFGHKVLLAQTGEKFIAHYTVLERQQPDQTLVDDTLAAHVALFGSKPDVFAADKGFYESMAKVRTLEKGIDTVAMCKKGRLTEEEWEREHSEAFRAGQQFRAGVEGSISVLKRAFTLDLCRNKGFRHFAATVGCAVFCHNLVLLARL